MSLDRINLNSIQAVVTPMRAIAKCHKLTTLAKGFCSARPQPYKGKTYEQIKALRTHVFPLYTHYYKEPFYPVQGFREFIFDSEGKKYIDLIGGISCVNVGYSHPRLTRIYEEEAGRLSSLSSHYVHQYQGAYSQKLCSELGNDLDTTFFFSSGSEANDFAVLLAKAYTKSNTVLALRNGYHGTAGHSYSLTNLLTWNSQLNRSVQLERLAWPNLYRSSHPSHEAMIRDAEEQLDSGSNGKVAGLWIEPIMGAGGIVPLPKEYIQGLYGLVKRHGGLYISDEVQSGFCRVGRERWGFKWHQVKPDIVVMAKAIANGQPLSAVVTRRQIADCLEHPFFTTYAAGPLQCRLAGQVLDILREDEYGEKAEEIGGFLLSEFRRVKEETMCPFIGDIRGKGMMIGVEIIKDQTSKEPNLEMLSHIFEKGRQCGVLFGKGGHKGHLIRVLGPLCLSRESATKAIGVFQQIIKNLPK